MTIEETMDYIGSFSKGGAPVHDLSRIASLLEKLDNPQDKLHVVHIAGTNGKGSVLSFCAAAAREAGFCVGTFTSPYLLRYNDRIRVNGADIPDDILCRLCERVARVSPSPDCSQFEITLAIALIWFEECHTDLCFLETGIGGSLDATNVVAHPLVCAITSISLDHQDILGDTLTQIAAQKAGIIKHGCPVVLSPDNSMDVVCLVQDAATRQGAMVAIPPMVDCRIITETEKETVFQYHSFTYTLHMAGRHQVYNALTAIEVIRFLGMHGFLISAQQTSEALASVSVPGRVQVLDYDPLVLLDGGHNPAGMIALVDLLQSIAKPEKKPIYAVLGMMKRGDYGAVCSILGKAVTRVFCVDDFTEGTVPAAQLVPLLGNCEAQVVEDEKDAIEKARLLAKENNGIAVICGSLYLVSRLLQDRTSQD